MSVVFVGLGEAEVHEKPIAEVLRDMAVEIFDQVGRRLLIGADDIAEVFGVELTGEGCGVDQVAEHDGQLPTLRVARTRSGCETLGG